MRFSDRRSRLAAGAALLCLAGACRGEPAPAPDVVARIGESDVRYAQFQSYLAQAVGEPGTTLASDVLTQLFDQFLDEELLARLAADRGAVASPAGAAGDARGRRRARRAIDALLARTVAEPSAAEVAAFYRAHRAEFARPERVRLRQILVEDRETAERALRELAAGGDSAAEARRLSHGGDQPGRAGTWEGGVTLSRRDLPPAFADIVFGLRPGEVSRIVPAEYGFHIFQVVERLPEEQVPLEQAAAEIRGRLRQERADRRLAELVVEARNQYTVVVYGRNLPFNYEGSYLAAKTGQDR
jgi:peptidyl-prolyl cis-trans isomerase C